MGREKLVAEVCEKINDYRRINTLLKSKACMQLFDTSPTYLLERARSYVRAGEYELLREWLEDHPNKTYTEMKQAELRTLCKIAGIPNYWDMRVDDMRECLLKDKVKVRDGFIAVNRARTIADYTECVPFLVNQVNSIVEPALNYTLRVGKVADYEIAFTLLKTVWSKCSAYSKLLKSRPTEYWGRCFDDDDEVVALGVKLKDVKQSIRANRLPKGINRSKFAGVNDEEEN